MRGVDAGVEYGHLRPGAVEASLPRCRSADLRRAVIEAGVHLRVQPDLRRAGGQAARAAACQVLPEPSRGRLGHVRGNAFDAGDASRHAGAARLGALGKRRRSVLDDDRNRRRGRVVVALRDQAGHVEEPFVDTPACDERHGLVRDHVERVASLEDVVRRGAGGRVQNRGGRVIAGRYLNPVARHQRHVVRGAAGRRRRCRGGARWRFAVGGRRERRDQRRRRQACLPATRHELLQGSLATPGH
jgi:hypothetical protein